MKPLLVLSIVQTLLLVILGMRVMSIDSRTNDLTLQIEAAQAQAASVDRAPRLAAAFPQDREAAEDIRRVIREEIALLSQSLPKTNYQSSSQQEVSRDDIDTAQLERSVRQDLDYYLSSGSISEGERAMLEQKMARLPPAQRKEMFHKLTKAMSSGEIEGRL